VNHEEGRPQCSRETRRVEKAANWETANDSENLNKTAEHKVSAVSVSTNVQKRWSIVAVRQKVWSGFEVVQPIADCGEEAGLVGTDCHGHGSVQEKRKQVNHHRSQWVRKSRINFVADSENWSATMNIMHYKYICISLYVILRNLLYTFVLTILENIYDNTNLMSLNIFLLYICILLFKKKWFGCSETEKYKY
jgi:hypothetical protein